MARCDQGYLCDVCGDEVESIRESDLYLRFVTGQLSSNELLATPERHLRCNPVVSQFVTVDGDFDRRLFDPADVVKRETLLTRG